MSFYSTRKIKAFYQPTNNKLTLQSKTTQKGEELIM